MTDLSQFQKMVTMNKDFVQGLLDSGHHVIATPEYIFFAAMTSQHDPFTTCAGSPYHFFVDKEEIDNFFRKDILSP